MVVLNILAGGGFGGIEKLNLTLNEENQYTNCFLFIKNKGDIFEKINEVNDKVLFFPIRSNVNNNIKEIVDCCKRWKVDIIINHFYTWYTVLYFKKLKKALPNVKFVSAFHSCHENNKLIPLYKRVFYTYVEKKNIKLAQYFILVSKAVYDSYYCWSHIIRQNTSKCKIIYNGIDDKYLTLGKDKQADFAKLKILYLGRIVKDKGVNNLISALKLLNDKNISYECDIVGDGDEKDNLIALAQKLGVKAKFHQSTMHPEDYYLTHNVFVYPSLFQEAFGISTIEASAFGLVPIVNNVGGLPEIITDGLNGLIVEKSNSTALANTLIKLQNLSLEEKCMLANNAKENAKRFTVSKTAVEYKNFFLEVLDNDDRKE